MKKILLSLFTILSLCAMLRADLNDALLHFNGTTDKNPLSYEVGEPMTFTFHFGEFNAEIPAGWKIQWVRKGDDGALADGLIVWDPAVPASFETTLNTEGFVRIIGNDTRQPVIGGLGDVQRPEIDILHGQSLRHLVETAGTVLEKHGNLL